MAISNIILNGGIVTFTIHVGGNLVPDKYNIFSVHVEKGINKVSTALIVILDGKSTTGEFDASSFDIFLPGNELIISAGYDSKNELIFSGIITKQSILIDGSVGSSLEIECRDTAVKMTVGRKSRAFYQKKDSEIITSIIGAYADISANITATTSVWPQQIQYYVTDWDFIVSLAETNGLIVTALNGKISVFDPAAINTSVLIVSYGDNLLTFSADLNSASQLNTVKASTWDYKNQVVMSGEATTEQAGPGNLSSKKLSAVLGLANYQLQTATSLDNAGLTNWSKAQLVKSGYSKIQGVVKFQGSNLVDPGKYITLQGIGDRLSGDHLISGVVHDISDGNWTTEVTIGLSSNWFIEEPDVISPSASGLLPGVRGLFNGTVKQMHEDPDSQFRILVDVPLFDQNGKGIWARLSNFYSTNGAGIFFLPEVGDEVVLGFLNEDPRCPIILGSMYSSAKLSPYASLAPNEKNSLKAIVSKSGIFLQFDDEDKILTIQTPDNNKIILSDKDKQLSFEDDNGNSITMSIDGITIKSSKDINIEANQNVNIKGPQGVVVGAAAGDVAISGINIKESAANQYSAEGNTMAKVSGGVQLTLKGAMVMIN